jgi:hypothetical protein
MPRGDNPNSRKNLAKGKPFTAETAREASKKGLATQKYNASFRAAGKDLLTDEEMAKMWKAMIQRAKNGNITAFKTLFEVMGEGQIIENNGEIRIAYLVKQDPPEKPPAEIEEENE